MELRKFNPTKEKYELLKGGIPKIWKQIAILWRQIFDAPAASLCSCNRTRRVKELEMAFELMKEQFEPKQEPIEEEPEVDEEQETDKVSDELLELKVDAKGKVKSAKIVKK